MINVKCLIILQYTDRVYAVNTVVILLPLGHFDTSKLHHIQQTAPTTPSNN